MAKVNIVKRRLDLRQSHDLTVAEARARQRGTDAPIPVIETKEPRTSTDLVFPLNPKQKHDLYRISKPGTGVELAAQLRQGADGILVLKIEQSPPETRKLLNSEEVSQLLGVSRSCVYRLVKEARLEALRIGRLLRFAPDEVNRFLLCCVGTEKGLR
ncbi:MAG: helix-turn-helix domain-containing protein [Acidobacteriota bacterium]|nr:MAG: helix-turn-helix domain-containing protein [Acidobacteriota bacterium]